jgi:hypothetical protein
MSNPTRFSNGVSTNDAQYLMGDYPLPSPFTSSGSRSTGVAEYANDFTNSVAEYTAAGSGSTFALTDGNGGLAILTPGGASTVSAAYKTATNVAFVAGNAVWFQTRFKVSAVSGTKSFYVGLRKGSATTDGLWFTKPASSTSVNLVSTVGSTATTLVTGVATAEADTYLELGLYFNGVDLLVYNNNLLVARVDAPTIGTSGTTLTSVALGPVLHITPTATDTLTVDYILASTEITR